MSDDTWLTASAVASITQLPHDNATGSLPPFGTQGQAAAYEFGMGYRVGAGDRLSIRVAGEQDLTGEYVVDPFGVLSLPYVQSVPVAGMNTGDIERLIVQRLQAGYLRDPQVLVQAVNLRPFYIMGEVTTGGSFPYQGYFYCSCCSTRLRIAAASLYRVNGWFARQNYDN